MAKKSDNSTKSDKTLRRVDSGENDKLIAELKKRVAVLENELQLKQGNTTSGEISDLKHTKNGLSRVLLDILLTRAPIGFAFFDRELRFVLINDRLAEINGIPAADHIGKSVRDIVPSLLPIAQKVVDQILATGQPVKDHEFCGETTLMPGVMRYWSESWYPVRDGLGEIVGFGAIVEEISERKQAEDALKASEKNARQRADELEALIDMIPAAVWVSRDPDCRTIVGNKCSNQYTEADACENISAGSARGEVYDRSRRFFKNGRELKPEELPMQEAVSKGTEVVNSEIDTLLPSGRRITVLGNAKPLKDANGQICGCVSLFMDITERKRAEAELRQSRDEMERRVLERTAELHRSNEGLKAQIIERKRAEEALRESQELLRTIIDSVPDPIFIKDRQSRLILANPATLKVIGKPLEEVIGRDDLEHYKDPAIGAALMATDRRIIESGNAEVVDEVGQTPDGYRTFISTKTPYRNNNGEVIGIIGISRDITERKRAEEVLGKNLAVLARSQEIAHLGSWTVDCDTGRFELSDEMYRIFGFEPGTVELTLDLSLKLTHPDDVNRYREFDESMRREGRLGGIDYRIVRPDGSVRYVYAQTDSVVRSQDGRVKTASGVTQDVTWRKRAEEALRKSQSRLEAVFRSMAEGVIIFDSMGNIIDANDSALQIFDYCHFDNMHKSPGEYNPAYDLYDLNNKLLPQGEWPINRTLRGESFTHYDVVVKRKDRDYTRILSYGGIPIRGPDNNIAIVIQTIEDITERKQAEEALQDSEGRYRALVETSPDGIIVHRDGKYLFANTAALRLHGADSFDQLQKFNVLELICPEDRERIAARIRHMEKGCVVPLYEGRLLRLDGQPVYFESTGTQINYGGGKASQVIIRDITKRKLAEDALKEAKTQAELYLDLMGHDINNMHQIALGYLELALGLPPGVQQYEMIEKPIEVLQRSAQLIKNVRKLQKHGEGMFHSSECDIVNVLSDVSREFGAVPNKTINLNLNGNRHCYVIANELLHDVFANLVSNAIKHTRDKADIVIGLNIVNDHDHKFCRVSVEDNGPGVPDDWKDRIFNRVLHGTNKAKGMGLGLYLVKSLVDSYGGRVWVEDRVKGDYTKGARFVVMLPAVDN